MRAIFESLFSVAYLVVIIMLGIALLRRNQPRQGYVRPSAAREKQGQYRLFGIMALILGGGDAFHLIPRIFANIGMDIPAALGFGTLVTSITMTVFYVLLYHFWKLRYDVYGRSELTICVYALAVIRVALCLFPQNDWFSGNSPLAWGIYRNIPFALLGALIIVLFFQMARDKRDGTFKHLWLAVLLSFVFYIPVVLFADAAPIVGMLMLPKTVMYVLIVCMGLKM